VNKLQKLLIFTILVCGIFLFTGRKVAADKYFSGESHSPNSYRTLCSEGTPVDFAAYPSNVNLDTSTGTATYNINIKWKRCDTTEETRAYAVYDGEQICPQAGYYGAGAGGVANDCVKYIGDPAYNEPGSGLSCFNGTKTNADCVTSNFSGARRVANQPSTQEDNITISMSTENRLWGFAKNSGTWTLTNQLCQFYKTGTNFTDLHGNSRCTNIVISLNWKTSTNWNYVHNSFSTNLTGGTNEVSKILGNTPYNSYPSGTEINIHDTPENTGDGDGRNYTQKIQKTFDQSEAPAAGSWSNIDTWDRNGINANTVANERSTKYTLPVRTVKTRVCFRGVITPVAGQSTPRSTITNDGVIYSTVRCVMINASPSGGFMTEPVISPPTLIPNEEVPTSATFNSGAAVDIVGADKVIGVTITRTYFIEKYDGSPNVYLTLWPVSQSNNLTEDVNFPYGPLSITGVVIGDRVCHDIKINPGSGFLNASGVITARGEYKYQKMCTTVSNKPYVTVYGGDVVVGGGKKTNGVCNSFSRLYANYDTTNFKGSGTQFLATAPGNIVAFSSALLRNSTSLKTNELTYANSSVVVFPVFGVFGGSNGERHCQNNYWGNKPSSLTTPTPDDSIDLSTEISSSGSYFYKPNTSSYINLSATSAIPSGKKIVLYIEGNVFITSNLIYSGTDSWASESDIPSLYIITKGNIYIKWDVTQLDGVFVAQPRDPMEDIIANGGRIYTCGGDVDPDPSVTTIGQYSLTSGLYSLTGFGICSQKQLVVNGAFDAQHIRLLRTGSSLKYSTSGEHPTGAAKNCNAFDGNKSVCSAEVFIFRPEVYLSSPFTPTVDKYQAITSLPPIL